jgi:MinD superfamily P-loop ATPase
VDTATPRRPDPSKTYPTVRSFPTLKYLLMMAAPTMNTTSDKARVMNTIRSMNDEILLVVVEGEVSLI